MGYAYEDEDIETTVLEKEKKKSTNKNKNKTKTSNGKFIVDNLMVAESTESKEGKQEYTVDNLLDSDEEKELYLKDLLNKKDARLFDAYLGKNSAKITNKNFNFAAFLFGGAYLIYRRLYGIGAFVLVLCIVTCILFPFASISPYVTFMFLLLVYLACGLFANQLILNNAAAKILNLKIQNEKNIKDKLVKMGGGNTLLFILALIINIIFLGGWSYKVSIGLIEKYERDNAPVFLEYDGQIRANESVNIRTLIDVEVPENYKTSHADAYQYSFSYERDANIAIDIVLVSRYKSQEDLIKGIANYEGKREEDIKEMTFLDAKWSCLETNASFYAVGIVGNRMYLVRHMHRKNSEASVDYARLLESIKMVDNT